MSVSEKILAMMVGTIMFGAIVDLTLGAVLLGKLLFNGSLT